MQAKPLSDDISVAPQVTLDDIAQMKEQGFKSLLCNRPDGEAGDQTNWNEIEQAAQAAGLKTWYQPIVAGSIKDSDVRDFHEAMRQLPKPVLAYCRTGTRSTTLWSLDQSQSRPLPDILAAAAAAGYDMSGVSRRIANGGKIPIDRPDIIHDVIIIGAGAAGIAVASSLRKRRPNLDVAIIDPSDVHYYQPGWTMVGGGIFKPEVTSRTMASLIPKGVKWIKSAVVAMEPDNNALVLEGCRVVQYQRLVVCPGLKLDWHKVDGLAETLGRNGVTSNYRFDLAPYTWELVSQLKGGRALFTQPPMPIKCAGAPQKAMYLSGDHWFRNGHIGNIEIEFRNAGGVLFGVKDYVPALEKYVERYNAQLHFFNNLIAIDGEAKTATFEVNKPDTATTTETVDFDMIHVCPPQTAPDFVRVGPLADAAGWVDVDQSTLQHKTYKNVWSLGDVMNAPNAKTAAAARKQAPVVAENLVRDIEGKSPTASYDGYGSCPLTVERGKIVLAEFGYGGILLPSFPKWMIDGTQPTRAAWLLKEKLLPPVYWHAMLRGHEWMAGPERVES